MLEAVMQPNSCFNCSHKAFKYIEMEMKAMLNMCFKVLDGFKKDNYPNQSKLTSLLKKRFWLQTALILKAEHKKKTQNTYGWESLTSLSHKQVPYWQGNQHS